MFAAMRNRDEKTIGKFSAYFKQLSAKVEVGGEVEQFFSENVIEIKMRVDGGSSSDTMIFSTIQDIKIYFGKLNEGQFSIAVAPNKCKLESFRVFLSPVTFPNLSKLFAPIVGERAKSPFGVPQGTILAWYPPDLLTAIEAGKTIQDLIPDGWGLCDGNDARPNLTKLFMYGTDDIKLIGSIDGENEHSHGGGTTIPSGARNPGDRGGNFEAMGIDHTHGLNIHSSNHIPRHLKAAFIIKL